MKLQNFDLLWKAMVLWKNYGTMEKNYGTIEKKKPYGTIYMEL